MIAAGARSRTTSERTNISAQAAGEFALDCPPEGPAVAQMQLFERVLGGI